MGREAGLSTNATYFIIMTIIDQNSGLAIRISPISITTTRKHIKMNSWRTGQNLLVSSTTNRVISTPA